MKITHCLAVAGLALAASAANAATYTEDFNAPFPTWESGWLGTNSNLTNDYGVGAGRGNNPDGLWVGETTIQFNSAFGAAITSLDLDVASWVSGNLEFYDASNTLISTQAFTANYGAYSNPGLYEHFSVSSTNGIDHFTFDAAGVVGNTSIDNVVVSTTAVPEPAGIAMMLAGVGMVAGLARRRQSRASV